MTAKDLLSYQFGGAEAIRRVAGSRYLLAIGAVLVLITSIPRNYDQTYIGEAPWWSMIPLLFSFISGSFVFGVLNRAFIRESAISLVQRYSMFIGLFWMTAPAAWLYGIPSNDSWTVAERQSRTSGCWVSYRPGGWRC